MRQKHSEKYDICRCKICDCRFQSGLPNGALNTKHQSSSTTPRYCWWFKFLCAPSRDDDSASERMGFNLLSAGAWYYASRSSSVRAALGTPLCKLGAVQLLRMPLALIDILLQVRNRSSSRWLRRWRLVSWSREFDFDNENTAYSTTVSHFFSYTAT